MRFNKFLNSQLFTPKKFLFFFLVFLKDPFNITKKFKNRFRYIPFHISSTHSIVVYFSPLKYDDT